MAGHEQDEAGRAVPVAEAAVQLGVTAETLRKRLWRGQAPGIKLDGQWFIYADYLEQDQAGHEQDRAEPVPDSTEAVPGTAGLAAGPSGPEQGNEQDTPTAPFVDQLQSEVRFLRSQVEALQERLREAHVLAAQWEQRALLAPSAPSAPRPWYWRWAWWRR